jgi:hypothetical protein
MAETCVQHPDVPALYGCDGCGKRLCGDCIEESHALFLCRLCGERALPLQEDRPASVKELAKERKLTGPYSLKDALSYPFRGTGLSLFLAVLFCTMVIWVLRILIFTGLVAGLLNFVLWLMIVGLQFKIVRSTSDGDDELPDWPDFFDFGSLIQDVATWLVIYGVVIVAVAYYAAAGLIGSYGNLEPRFDFWLGFAVVLWLGTAFAVMAYGAAGTYSRIRVLFVHRHVQGFLAAGADAVHVTNLAFGLGAAIFMIQPVLARVPLLGSALASVVGTYWVFLLPHLAGLVFRRHNKRMDQLYWSEYGG